MSPIELSRDNLLSEIAFRNAYPNARNDFWLSSNLATLGGLASAW